nr:MAG TPA: hypothetical protein [Caudoviricetes sp.]
MPHSLLHLAQFFVLYDFERQVSILGIRKKEIKKKKD